MSKIVFSGTASASRTDVGTTYMGLEPKQFSNSDDNFTDVTFEVVDGYVEITTAYVTLIANSGYVPYNGADYTLTGFTCSNPNLTFPETVFATSGIVSERGAHPVYFSEDVKENVTTDTTGNYVVKEVVNGVLVISDKKPVEKSCTFNGNLASYTITVNPYGYELNNGAKFTLEDEFSETQSVIYNTINIQSDEPVTYDYSGFTGTYVIPDSTPVTITYQSRISGAAGTTVDFHNTATLKRSAGDVLHFYRLDNSESITPTGTDTEGTSGVYTLRLYVYGENNMQTGLEGAKVRLLDSNRNPITYTEGGEEKEVTFTTAEQDDGQVYATIELQSHGMAIHKNTLYYLEMITAPTPVDNGDGTFTYYQKETTIYNFLITDNPDYSAGTDSSGTNIMKFYNNDVLKWKCYTASAGVNVTNLFSGNYVLTEEQKNAIVFRLQEYKNGWQNVESHAYSEFSKWGTMSFTSSLKPTSVYRLVEENDAIEGVTHTVAWSTTSYYEDGKTDYASNSEFEVDPNNPAVSYNIICDNAYIAPKLTIVLLNEETGNRISGGKFNVCKASDSSQVGGEITTNEEGLINIDSSELKTDENPDGIYSVNTLYYIAQTFTPNAYLLPLEAEKTYFFFSSDPKEGQNRWAPSQEDGLPSGVTAIDLSQSFSSVTIYNAPATVDVPVVITWGLDGKSAWPAEVSKVCVGLYQKVNGVTSAVPDPNHDENNWTIELSEEGFYDNTTFVNRPARKTVDNTAYPVEYSVRAVGVYDTDGDPVTSSYAASSGISGTGWHVVRLQPGISVVVEKQWYDQNEDPVADTSGKQSVTFDLYRATDEPTLDPDGSITREALEDWLIREKNGTKLDDIDLMYRKMSDPSWSVTIPSLPKQIAVKGSGDTTEYHNCHYFVLEKSDEILNNGDSYVIDTTNRKLTIKNTQTKVTVTVNPRYEEGKDCVEKVYDGTTAPGTYSFDVSVAEAGVLGSCSGPDESGNYTVTITKEGETDQTFTFTVPSTVSADVDTYTIKPVIVQNDTDYRVVLGDVALKINRKAVTVTAGKQKIYGTDDPVVPRDLATVTGLVEGEDASLIFFEALRDPGEDAGSYSITISDCPEEQGNYSVSTVDGYFVINPRPVVVKADNKSKVYGDDEPDFTVTISRVEGNPDSGLVDGDSPDEISWTATREDGEDVGKYTITPAGDSIQGNYSVTYAPGTLTIQPCGVEVAVADAEKTYGEIFDETTQTVVDPEWEITIEGLKGDDADYSLTYTPDADNSYQRNYICTVGSGEDAHTLLTFMVSRVKKEDVGEYDITITPNGDDVQGNYKLTCTPGKLTISRAALTVTAVDQTKVVGQADPDLTVRMDGLANSDTEDVIEYDISREAGDDAGDYRITVSGEDQQGNYEVQYVEGTLTILPKHTVTVSMSIDNKASSETEQQFTCTATLDYTGTALEGSDYVPEGFTKTEEGVISCLFALKNGETRTFDLPEGVKLTASQEAHSSFATSVSVNGDVVPAVVTDESVAYTLEVDAEYTIAFNNAGIGLPMTARACVNETENNAQPIAASDGYLGVQEDAYPVNAAFADMWMQAQGYTLPTSMHYLHDHVHASLYPDSGDPVANITGVKFDSAYSVWKYTTAEDIMDDSQYQVINDARLVLFYEPQYICQVPELMEGGNPRKFYTIQSAMSTIQSAMSSINGSDEVSADIEMLLDYTMPSTDTLTVPADYRIKLTKASSLNSATITRAASFTSGHMVTNNGMLKLDAITLDGTNAEASDAMVLNKAHNSEPVVLTVTGTATLRNANGANGGAIYIYNGTVNVQGTITGNIANHGGAIFLSNGALNIQEGATVTDNQAADGGAIYQNDGTLTIFANAGVTNNRATQRSGSGGNGGAIYKAAGTASIRGNVTDNSAAKGNGGGIYQGSGTTVITGRMTDNGALNGGGVYQAGGQLDIADGALVTGNTATQSNGNGGNGGAMFAGNGTVNVTGGTIGAEGSPNTALNGGAIYATGTAMVNFTGGEVMKNTARDKGGAIYFSGSGVNKVTLSLTGGEFSNNTAVSGGMLYTDSNYVVISGGFRASGNTADNGGALYYAGVDTVTVGEGASFSGNQATTGNGGAFYMASGTITLTGVAAEGNKAEFGRGGAAYSASTGTLKIIEGSYKGNSAKEGGALCATLGNINVSNADIVNNAAENGGAIYYASVGSVTVTEGSVKGNRATTGDGGAVYATSGTIILTGVAAEGNKAESGRGGAVFYSGAGTVEIKDEDGNETQGLKGNEAQNGGAVYATGGSLTVASANVTGNKASNHGGAVYYAAGDTATITGTLSANTAANYGGAVYLSDGTASFTAATAFNGANQAKDGAAVYAAAGTVNFAGCNITGNRASVGGAVGAGSGATLKFSGAVSITGNTDNAEVETERKPRNVYLSVDSDVIINDAGVTYDSSTRKAVVGVSFANSVPTDTDPIDLSLIRGEVCGCFGTTLTDNETNTVQVFKNDQWSDLEVFTDNGKI